MVVKLLRVYLLFFVLSSVCISGFTQTIQDDISAGKIPLLPSAQAFSGPHLPMASGAPALAMFTTGLSKEQVIKFYIKELAKRGWRNPQNLFKMFKQYNLPVKNRTVSGRNVNMARLLQNILYFRRNKQTLMLMVVPPKGHYYTETIFSLAYINVPAPVSSVHPMAVSLPNYIPLYPGARLVSSAGGIYGYITSEDIKSVELFYKQQMVAYGWDLDNGTPLERIQVKVPAGILKSDASCPGCPAPKDMPASLAARIKRGVVVLRQEFDFSRGREKCKILISKLQSSSLPVSTQISIIYNAGQ